MNGSVRRVRGKRQTFSFLLFGCLVRTFSQGEQGRHSTIEFWYNLHTRTQTCTLYISLFFAPAEFSQLSLSCLVHALRLRRRLKKSARVGLRQFIYTIRNVWHVFTYIFTTQVPYTLYSQYPPLSLSLWTSRFLASSTSDRRAPFIHLLIDRGRGALHEKGARERTPRTIQRSSSGFFSLQVFPLQLLSFIRPSIFFRCVFVPISDRSVS